MLSVFPVLFDFSLIGVALLRVTTGIFFLIFGSRLIQVVFTVQEKGKVVRFVGLVYATLKLFVGISLTVGVFTQIGALAGMGVSILTFLQDKSTNKSAQQLHILLFVLCLSLLFLGPGLYAVDYPL